MRIFLECLVIVNKLFSLVTGHNNNLRIQDGGLQRYRIKLEHMKPQTGHLTMRIPVIVTRETLNVYFFMRKFGPWGRSEEGTKATSVVG